LQLGLGLVLTPEEATSIMVPAALTQEVSVDNSVSSFDVTALLSFSEEETEGISNDTLGSSFDLTALQSFSNGELGDVSIDFDESSSGPFEPRLASTPRKKVQTTFCVLKNETFQIRRSITFEAPKKQPSIFRRVAAKLFFCKCFKP
jgi:hypothetical protein